MSETVNTEKAPIEADHLVRYVKIIASAYGLFTVLATLFGYYYHKGFLLGYGVSTDLFPISIQDALILSHEAFLSIFSKASLNSLTSYKFLLSEALVFSGIVVVIFLVMLFVIPLAWFDKLTLKRPLHTQESQPLSNKQKGWVTLLSGGYVFAGIYLIPRLIFFTLLMISFAPVLSYITAKKDAHDAQSKSICSTSKTAENEEACDVLSITTTEDDKPVIRKIYGDVIAANDKWIAISIKNKTKVVSTENVEIQFRQPVESQN